MAVYFARAAGTTFVKIGYAASVSRRMLLLQPGCPYQLTVARTVPGDRLTESAFHALFAEHHIDRDWFNWSPRMATENLRPSTPEDAGSFSALITELGGPTVVSRKTGIPLDAIKKIRARNRIPASHWPAFVAVGIPAERLIACEVARAA